MRRKGKIAAPFLAATLLMSACAPAERSHNDGDVATTGTAAETTISPESEIPAVPVEEEKPDYLASFHELADRIGFDFYDVAHLYNEPALLSVGMAENAADGTRIYLFLMDSEESAEKKAMALRDSFGEGDVESRGSCTLASMNGCHYLVAVGGSDVYMVVAPESIEFEKLAAWIEVEIEDGEKNSEAQEAVGAEGEISDDSGAAENSTETSKDEFGGADTALGDAEGS